MEAMLHWLIDRFPDLMDINLTASVVILFVICVRQFLKGAPKIFSYALWGIVLLRLLVPVSVESAMSFVPERTEFSSMVEVNAVLPDISLEIPQHREENQWIAESTAPGEPVVLVERSVDAQTYLTLIWLLGISVMLLQSAACWWKLRRKLKVVIPYRKGIFLADDIDTPFVMGLFRPRIYLPGTLKEEERKYIIAHERHHIRRGDHIFKALGFLALTVHWFNPFVWAAFVLAGRDMEMSCDEAVIRKYGPDIRADYSASLLNLATGHRQFSLTPLAFGEGDTTGRVRNLAKWKKPAFRVVLVCVIVCAVLALCLLTDPETAKPLELPQKPAQTVEIELHHDPLPEGYYELRDETGSILFTDGTETVGGVVCYRIPEGIYDPDDHIDTLLYKMGIPDYLDTALYYRGGMTSGDNGWLAEFESDVPEGEEPTVHRRHHFCVMEDLVYDIWFDMLRLDYEKAEDLRLCVNVLTAEVTEYTDWGVTLKPDRVSRTGATALFAYSGSIPGEEGAELTYGDFLSLDRMEDGSWIRVPELEGFDYFVGDSSYPVVDGYGMVHEWPRRFGELPDGHYRLGKQLTLLRPDGTTESRMVYGEFSIPDSILTGPIPLDELPEHYSQEQAMIDGCVVVVDGIPRHNEELFQDFADTSWHGTPGTVRIVFWLDKASSLYEKTGSPWVAMDLSFDGIQYTLTSQYAIDGRDSYTFRYLKNFEGMLDKYTAYCRYVLTNDQHLEWETVSENNIGSSWIVYTSVKQLPRNPQLPANPAQATLEFEGEALVTITDFDRLEKIWLLFENAEYLGYEPKTHSIGVDLNLVLLSQSGETLTIELNPDGDTCRIDGEYVFYGAFDEPDYIEKLWYYLDIEAWPDAVYEKYPHAYQP